MVFCTSCPGALVVQMLVGCMCNGSRYRSPYAQSVWGLRVPQFIVEVRDGARGLIGRVLKVLVYTIITFSCMIIYLMLSNINNEIYIGLVWFQLS